jgi:hypothetical protein
VADEEGRILQKIEMALQIFERDYDLSADLARVATEELANMNISHWETHTRVVTKGGGGSDLRSAAEGSPLC